MGEVASFVFAWLDASWIVLQSSSLWLLLGFFLAGLINVYLPQETIKSHLKGGGLKAVVKASAIGVPLPLCSCSVIPVAVSLRKSGASRGATASFLVSTPEIGVDSFLLSSGLLGLPFACLRAFAAFVSAFTVGVLIDHFPEKTPVVQPDASGVAVKPLDGMKDDHGLGGWSVVLRPGASIK